MTVDLSAYEKVDPVFICGHYRSGTSLVNHLLDGHPEVNACLIETKYFTRFLPDVKGGISPENALKTSMLRHFYTQTNLLSKVYATIDPDDFLERYYQNTERLKSVPTNHFDAYLLTAAELIAEKPEHHKIWVEKTPLNELYQDEILNLWPKAKFLCVIRDPRDMHATIKARSKFDLHVRTTIHNWERSFDAIHRLMQKHPDRVYFVKYEDLVESPEKHMQAIAEFCGIRFEPSLLSPSSVGGRVDWKGNAKDDNYEGVSTKSVGKWRSIGLKAEMQLIETMLAGKMNILHYKLEFKPSIGDYTRASWNRLVIYAKRIRQLFKGEPAGAY